MYPDGRLCGTVLSGYNPSEDRCAQHGGWAFGPRPVEIVVSRAGRLAA
jgi:hypothetical protein